MNLNGDAIQTSATRISQAREVLIWSVLATIGGYASGRYSGTNRDNGCSSRYCRQRDWNEDANALCPMHWNLKYPEAVCGTWSSSAKCEATRNAVPQFLAKKIA